MKSPSHLLPCARPLPPALAENLCSLPRSIRILQFQLFRNQQEVSRYNATRKEVGDSTWKWRLRRSKLFILFSRFSDTGKSLKFKEDDIWARQKLAITLQSRCFSSSRVFTAARTMSEACTFAKGTRFAFKSPSLRPASVMEVMDVEYDELIQAYKLLRVSSYLRRCNAPWLLLVIKICPLVISSFDLCKFSNGWRFSLKTTSFIMFVCEKYDDLFCGCSCPICLLFMVKKIDIQETPVIDAGWHGINKSPRKVKVSVRRSAHDKTLNWKLVRIFSILHLTRSS